MNKIGMRKIKPFSCPYCGTTCVAASDADGKPTELVYECQGFCVRCKNVFIMVDAETVRKCTPEEKVKYDQDPEILKCKLLVAQYEELVSSHNVTHTIN